MPATSLALMVLRRGARMEVDFASLVGAPRRRRGEAVVRVPRIPLAAAACTAALGSIGVAATAPLGVSTEVLEAEVTDVDGPAAAAS
ncbi:MAG: hypothetical protein R2694_15260 [Ilumatobacteraceae bacterium]